MIRPVSAREDDEQQARQQKKRRVNAAYRISGLAALQQRARQELPAAVVALLQALDGSRRTRSADRLAKSAQATASDAGRLQAVILRVAQSSVASSSGASRHAAALLASRHPDPVLQKPILRIKDPDADAASGRASPKAGPLPADADAKRLFQTLWDDPEALTRPGQEQQLDTVLREVGKLTDQLGQEQAQARQAQANRDEGQLGAHIQRRQGQQDVAHARSEKFNQLQHQRQALPPHEQKLPGTVAPPAELASAGQLSDGIRAAGQDASRRLAGRKPRPAQKAGADERASERALSQANREQGTPAVAQPPKAGAIATDLLARGQLRYLIGFFEQESRTNPRAAQLHGALTLLDQEIARASAAEAAWDDSAAQSAFDIKEQSVAGSKSSEPHAEQSSLQSWIDTLDQLARALAAAAGPADHASAMQFLLPGQLVGMTVPSLLASGAKRTQHLKIAADIVDRLMQVEHLIEQSGQDEAAAKLKQLIFDQRQRWEREIEDNKATRPDPAVPGQAPPASRLDHDDTFFHRQLGSH